LTNLPVVDDDAKLVGIISFTDIGVALLAKWQQRTCGDILP
jgi:CBS-domain-containing membrane protein